MHAVHTGHPGANFTVLLSFHNAMMYERASATCHLHLRCFMDMTNNNSVGQALKLAVTETFRDMLAPTLWIVRSIRSAARKLFGRS